MEQTAINLIKQINEYGYKAYIVGGYPRDLYLKRESIDIDICTDATPKALKEIFKDSVLPKQQYGGVTILRNHIRFEITTFRKEIKYENNRFPVKMKYIHSLLDDLKRRDFTMNTLCMDETGELLDLLNAKPDLDQKIIRSVGSADHKIKEDILRSLRAIRFATVLNFTLDDQLKKAIIKRRNLLKKLSFARKKEELDKIFASTNASYGLELLKELKLEKNLDLSNLDSVVVTTTPLGIWAQLEVLDIYPFTNSEKHMIKAIQKVMPLDVLDNYVLYKNDLYVCTIVGEIHQIDRALIVAKYNALPIHNTKELALTPLEICTVLNMKPGSSLKDIINDLEYKIIIGELQNRKEDIISYLLKFYDEIEKE